MKIYFEEDNDDYYFDIRLTEEELEKLMIYKYVSKEAIFMKKNISVTLVRRDEHGEEDAFD